MGETVVNGMKNGIIFLIMQERGFPMSSESAKAFVAKMASDGKFANMLKELTDSAAREAFVRKAGFDFTLEELAQQREMLSDEELGALSGGSEDPLSPEELERIKKILEYHVNPTNW